MTTRDLRTKKFNDATEKKLFLEFLTIYNIDEERLSGRMPEGRVHSRLHTVINSILISPNFRISWIPFLEELNSDINYAVLSENKNIDISWIDRYPDKNWCFHHLGYSENFDISWVIKYQYKDWNWCVISASKNLDVSWINAFPNKDWNWFFVSKAPKLTIDWLVNNPNYTWYWDIVSEHPNFDIDWVSRENKFLNNWVWGDVSRTKNFKYHWIDMYPDADWDWDYLSTRSNFDVGMIKKYENKWNYNTIRKLNFQSFAEDFLEKQQREYMAAYKIQQWWKEITISPNYAIGRRFINKRFDELFHSNDDE
jgi:hypothetical protein